MKTTTSKRIIGHTASGKPVPHARAKVYTERHRVARWNTEPSLLTSGAPAFIVRRQFPQWSASGHMDAARLHANERDRLLKLWRSVARKAEAKYGIPPVYISGGVSDIYPDAVNDRLRSYAHGASDEGAASAAHYYASGKRTPYGRTDLAHSY